MGWTPGESICSSAASLPCGKIPRVCGRAGSFGESIKEHSISEPQTRKGVEC